MKERSIRVIDHFYKDPFTKRKEALLCEYQKSKVYAGVNSIKQFHLEEAMKKIEDILGTPVRWDEFTVNGRYRISTALDTFRQDIHPDSFLPWSPFPQWVGVCHLTLPKNCQGGTSFWKHKKTGFEKYPVLKKELARVNRIANIPNTPKEIGKYFLEEGLDRSRWLEVRKVPMIFNQLVLFKSDLFHTYTSIFGNSRENSRLVHLFCFDEVDYFIKMIRMMAYSKKYPSRKEPPSHPGQTRIHT